MEWIYQRDLVVFNQVDRPTFLRYNQKSYIDLTLCSEYLAGNMSEWRVLEEETSGWHQVILYNFEIQKRKPMRAININNEPACGGWRTTTETINNFETHFHNKMVKEIKAGRSLNSETFTECVTDTCNQVFKKKSRYLRGKRGGMTRLKK